MPELVTIDAAVASRAAAITAQFPEWPCRKGCDDCCHNLSRIPVLTQGEWVRLRDAIAELSSEQREQVASRIGSMGARPIVCPLLDRPAASCLAYEARPVACRSYGFYADREGGLYCGHVGAFARGIDGIIWGNQEAVEARLDALGQRKSLREWLFADGR